MAPADTLLRELWNQFSAASLLEQVAFVATIGGLTIISVVGAVFSAWKYRDASARLKATQGMVEVLSLQRREADAQNQMLEQLLAQSSPEVWLRDAAVISSQQGAQAGANRLRLGYENVRRSFSEVCRKLAEHHLARSEVRPEELGEASALAQLAAILVPDDTAAGDLALMVNEVRAASSNPLKRYTDDPNWSESLFADNPEDAAAEVHELAKRAEQASGNGDWSLARRLGARAVAQAERARITRWPEAAFAMLQHAEALQPFGLYDEAIALLDRALDQPRSPKFMKTPAHAMSLKGQILWRSGRFPEALKVLNEAIPELDSVCSPTCHFLFDARLARAQVMSDLGRNEDALSHIDELIRTQEMAGQRDVRLLHAQIQRAQFLGRLGKHQDALSRLEDLGPRLIGLHGAESPHVHWLKHLRAEELWRLGRKEEAIVENAEAISGMDKALGVDHPDTRSFVHVQNLWNAEKA